MNILFTFLSFAKDVFGGIENSVLNLGLGIQKLGGRVSIYTSFLGGSELLVEGIDVFRSHTLLPPVLPQSNTQRDIAIKSHLTQNAGAIRQEISTIVLDREIDVIIAFDLLWGIAHVTELWTNVDCPIVSSLHVVNEHDLLDSAKSAPYLFHRCVSDDLRLKILSTVQLAPVETIPNSIDTARFSPTVRLQTPSRAFFCNSRIDPAKGISELLEGFAQFAAGNPDYSLWLCAGESPFGDRVEALPTVHSDLRRWNLEGKVHLLPNLTWHEIPDRVRSAFAVVLPTKYESFGRAALEALACGTPLIATRVGNLPDLVGDCAIWVNPGAPDEIRRALELLAARPELHRELSRVGPIRAARYDNAIVAGTMIAAIKRRA